jgi:hydroxylaminobenzene mutase
MESSDWRERHGHRLLRLGIFLFLLGLLVGLAVPRFAVPRLGLSTHLLGIMQGIFLMVMGLLWPKLRFRRMTSRIGVVLAVYGCVAALTANFAAAVWGAGNGMLPIAAGESRGSGLQEVIIAIGLRSAGVSLITFAALVLWGLRSVGAGSLGE